MNLAANFILLLAGAGLIGAVSVFLATTAPFLGAVDYAILFAMAMLAVLCAAAFRRDAATRHVLALCLISAATAAVAAEFTIAGQAMPSYVDGGLGVKSAREALLDLRAGGVRAYVSLLHKDITPPDAAGARRSAVKIDGASILPMSGVARAPTVLCNEAGQWVVYDSDRFGFRNPESSWTGPVDLATVGDSYTQGNCVADGDSFVDRLRVAYPRTVNLGQRGNGPFAILASIREYLGERRPKTTIWFHYEGNDLPNDMQREQRTPLFLRYLDPEFSQNLLGRAPETSAALARYIDRRLNEWTEPSSANPPRARPWLTRMRARLPLYEIRSRLGLSNFPDTALSEIFETILETAKTEIAGWNGRLILVYLPAARRFTSAGARRGLNRYRSVVFAAAEALGIPVLDMSARFSAMPDPASLFRGHFTEEGHAFMAREVQQFLNRRGL